MDDSTAFRHLSGRFATGVAVVTADSGDGVAGSTVNSFASLSLDPLMVLFCLRHTSATRQVIEQTGRYSVSILSDAQRAVSDHFARRGGPLPDAALHRDGCFIRVRDALAWFDCALEGCLPGGDHVILTGKVIAFSGPAAAPAPLIYHHGAYTRLDPQKASG